MSLQEEKARIIEVSYQDYQDEASVIDSIADAPAQHSSTARIHKVPQMVKETQEYGKYYVPKVVSIGPYHFGNPKLKMIEKLKPCFTMKLLSSKETLESLYKKLGEAEMVKELRNYYEEKTTDQFCDKVFTKMMLLDGCFILYYIKFIYAEKLENCLELKSHQTVFIHQDLFLLENQIPFKVLNEVLNLIKDDDCYKKIKPFIDENILARERPKIRWFCYRNDQSSGEEAKMDLINDNPDHLLHILHHSLTKKHNAPKYDFNQTMINRCTNFIGGICLLSRNNNRCTFRNVNELMDVGIEFKPSCTMSLAHIEYFKSWWFFSANVELPPITVDDSTKPMLLNLVAYEMCSCDANDSWVTSYICLLDSLIDHPEDVKTLRKAGVLDNSLGSDKEVARLFNEIGTDLVPNSFAYSKAKDRIQRHYESWRNTLFSQLKHEYVKSPWAFIALLGALIALFLSGVQAYFSVWSPKSQCDDLCLFHEEQPSLIRSNQCLVLLAKFSLCVSVWCVVLQKSDCMCIVCFDSYARFLFLLGIR